MDDVRGRSFDTRPEDTDTLVGQLIGDRYRVVGLIAVGGMARVYTAEDLRMPRTVAVKIVRSRHETAPVLAAFRREAEVTARLRHPNVVGVFDSGEHLGRPYIVMEYVAGPTLRDILNARTRVPARQALRWCRQVLAALATAHRAGLVHRDVKPENILIHRRGGRESVKVADFGLAQPIRTAGSAEPDPGPLLATVVYLAPELAAGDPVDARADLYSVGILLFELLTGEVPFDDGDPQAVVRMHLDRSVPPPSRLLPELAGTVSDLVVTATRRRPSERFRDAEDFAAAVDVVLRCLAPVTAAPTTPRQRTTARPTTVPAGRPRPGRRRVFAAALAVALLLAGGGWWLTDGRYRPAPRLVGDHLATVAEDTARLDLRVSFAVRRFSDTAAPGTVLSQSPAPGTRMLAGDTVTVTLSHGSGRSTVPRLAGHGRDYAAAVLAAHGRRTRFADTADPAPIGTVLGTDPPAGAAVPPDGTVTVLVAAHPEDVVVPAVVGRSWSATAGLLRRAGVTARPVTGPHDTVADGRVVGQDLLPGSRVAPGTVMTVTVSTGRSDDR